VTATALPFASNHEWTANGGHLPAHAKYP